MLKALLFHFHMSKTIKSLNPNNNRTLMHSCLLGLNEKH